jgi:catechol 2,3-dioxygenase-like lactoylglutathione lyase family enzyme
MKPRITLITLGVDDLERSLRFYRDGLGFSTEGIIGQEFEYGAVVFFELESGLRLALWPRKSLAHDSGLPLGKRSATEFTLAHNVSSESEVDAVMNQAKKAGAVIVKPAQPTFYGGYAGYFQDPDGHMWEVAWNPQWSLPD